MIDPLNWNPWLKFFTLLQVSFLAFLGPFTQAYIVSSPPPMIQVDTHAESSYRTPRMPRWQQPCTLA